MKRLISIFLVVVLALGVLVACGDSNETSSLTVNDVQTDEFKDANGNYVPRHEVVDLNGREFTIIVRGASAGTYQSDDFTTESEMYGDLIETAVRTRNDKVESLYNVTLNVVKSDDINNDIMLDCTSNLGTYDAIMPTLNYLSKLSIDAFLHDLKSIENFDEEAPWYDQNCSEAFSFNDQLYFTTGDITILNKVNTPSILFNKEMVAKYFSDIDFYQLVREKKWTFDTMVEYARQVSNIVTNDGSYSDDNTYGMVTAYGDALLFYGASGEKICNKDDEDLPYLSIGTNERSTKISRKILETLTRSNWLVHAQECADPIWDTSFEVFYEGRALFRPSYFSATTKLRSRSNIEFGILPVPLMDETQDEYYSYCSTSQTVGIAIPVSAKDPEFSAYMIEAYSAWAKNYLTTAYYDVNLMYKDIRDEESAEMLNIIFDNIVYDIGECYDFGGLSSMFHEMVAEKSVDFVSTLESKKSAAQTKIDELKFLYAYGK